MIRDDDFDGALFEWDQGNVIKSVKHGVSIQEIHELFNLNPFVLKDERHSNTEERFIAVGTVYNRNLFVVFIKRLSQRSIVIRVISARYMHLKEVEFYERLQKRD